MVWYRMVQKIVVFCASKMFRFLSLFIFFILESSENEVNLLEDRGISRVSPTTYILRRALRRFLLFVLTKNNSIRACVVW